MNHVAPSPTRRSATTAAVPCVVHIGAPKTGTTWLQKVFTDNRELLAARSIHYPDVSLRGYGHHDLAFLLDGGYPEWATPQPRSLAALESLLTDTVRSARGTFLLSSENFYLLPQPHALRLLLERAGLDPTIVVYLRRQDEAHESWYNQTIKAQGYTHSIDECVRDFHALWDYEVQLAAWANAFGRDALRVRLYDANDLLGDFAAASGLNLAGLAVAQDTLNTGLNRDVLEFQRAINGLPLKTVEKRRFHKQLIALSAETRGQGLFDEAPLLTSAQRREVLSSYAASNRAVAQQYFGRSTLFDEEIPDGPSPSPAGLTSEKLMRIVGWLLAKEAPGD